MKKILVADDSLTIQKVIRLALSNESYEIQAVSDGKDALEQIALFRPHVVLIDVSLPGLSAFELKRKINESPEFRHTQFVLMSSAFEQVDEAQANEARFAGRLVKPFDPGNLREVLQDVLSNVPAEPAAPSRPAAPSAPPPRAAAVPPKPSGDAKISLAPPDPSLVPDVPDDEDENEDEDFDDDRTLALEPASGALSGNEPPRLSEDLWDGDKTVALDRDDEENEEDEESRPDPDEDIRKLTESTIKMSGLDDFQWSVSESARKDETPHEIEHEDEVEEPASQFTIRPPSEERREDKSYSRSPEPMLEPHPNMLDLGGSSFEVPLFARGAASSGATTAKPKAPAAKSAPAAQPAASPRDLGARSVYESAPEGDEPEPPFQLSGFPADDLKVDDFGGGFQMQDYSSDTREPEPTHGPGGDLGHPADTVALSNDQIEHIVRQQVQERLQEIARKMLPELAERIIKEEIHKMLSNPP